MAEFVFTMHNVRKTLGEKLILDNVTMSFYPDAKIGVVGPNGAGKSTMLKIMAGLENANNGDVMLAKGKTVGMLMQEPPLTEDKTVLENVQEGVAETKALLDRYNEISAEARRPGRRLRHPARGDGRPVHRARPPQGLGARLEARPGDGCAALPRP